MLGAWITEIKVPYIHRIDTIPVTVPPPAEIMRYQSTLTVPPRDNHVIIAVRFTGNPADWQISGISPGGREKQRTAVTGREN